ncbi:MULTISPECIES: retropepsin-like aspartic protease [Leptolyngbya]|uniref:Retropepsin-like aspartic protease n=1 Tax=Leptolyngbya boryana CZ1 TaxID=3060204 RepID=A0AA96WZZ3_LEPBY|nr:MULTISPECIES: retropepsin-like aspartic protease [Leptolyngbya]MCY6490139.1 retropepsin-like aspartic protease [Leptolyngbya sp. GGD]WNZ47224.1 retropepsin-like aspartic protease [Leptolyngbya boryana CZ1]
MSSRVIYPLQRSGNLLFLRASIRGLNGDSLRVRLLLDTGSSYTTLPFKVLEDLGYEPSIATRQISIMTAGGMSRAPVLPISAFDCLGKTFTNFSIVALDLPFNPLMSGLLGMDCLSQIGAVIDVQKAEILMRS